MSNRLNDKKILLYSHELTYTGAPTSLLRIAKVLLKQGCRLELWSKKEGDYWREFDALNVPVKIVPDAEIVNHAKEINGFDLAIANTIVSYRFYDESRKYIPTIWYIREAQNIRTIFGQNFYWKKIFVTAEELYCVSEYAAAFIKENYNSNVKVLHNCVEDFYAYTDEREETKFPLTILMMGSVTVRKGFRIAVEALLALPEEYRCKINLKFAGQIVGSNLAGKYAKELFERIEGVKNIEYLGELHDKEEIMETYRASDVVLVPSQDESCSLVVLEGAMQAKPLIVTENVGAKYMVSEENGWIFPTDNVEELAKIFIEVVSKYESLNHMGLVSRRKYEELASMQSYEADICRMVEEHINIKLSNYQKVYNHMLSYAFLNERHDHLENVVKKKENRIRELEEKKKKAEEEEKRRYEKLLKENARLKEQLSNLYLKELETSAYKKGEIRRKRAELKALSGSKLFDAKWYLNQYPEIRKDKMPPAKHYYTKGWMEGKDPSLYFSTQKYLELNPDVKGKNICPVVHYELYGGKSKCRFRVSKLFDEMCCDEKIRIKLIENSRYFDSKWYAKKYLKDAAGKYYAAEHYYLQGWQLGYDPSKRFSSDDYLEANPDIAKNGICPLFHYEKIGRFEGRMLKSVKTDNYSKLSTEELLIVSLTVHKEDLYNLRKTVRSLTQQTVRPSKIVFSMSEQEFPLKENGLPVNLLDCPNMQTEILWSSFEGYGELIPVQMKYPAATVIAARPGFLYPERWIEELYAAYQINPKRIYCYNAFTLAMKKESFFVIPGNTERTDGEIPSGYFYLPDDASGVLYPAGITADCDANEGLAKEKMPKNSVVAYWLMSVKKKYGISVIQTTHGEPKALEDSRKEPDEIQKRESLAKDVQNCILLQEDTKEFLKEEYGKLEVNKKIKLIVPANPKGQEYNGDYHYAVALQHEFERRGYIVDFRYIEDWYKPFDGKYVIVIRGAFKYECEPWNYNIMWNISHPEDITTEEYASYDAVCIASSKWEADTRARLDRFGSETLTETMLQCTDENVFGRNFISDDIYRDILFVGMRHPEGRKIVDDLLPTEYDFALYGPRWKGYIPLSYLKGEVVLNDDLPKYYHGSAITLNDTRPEMKAAGFVSNRIYDVLAAGGFVISDYIEDIQEIFGNTVITYDGTHENLERKIKFYLEHKEKRAKKIQQGRELVLQKHTFKHRVDQFVMIMQKLEE